MYFDEKELLDYTNLISDPTPTIYFIDGLNFLRSFVHLIVLNYRFGLTFSTIFQLYHGSQFYWWRILNYKL